MRARRRVILGSVAVGLYASALVAMAVTTSHAPVQPGEPPGGGQAATALIAAWRRAGEATFIRFGTFERRSEVTGAAITSEDVLAQRPPRRIHRQLGGVEGRDDDRLIVCPASPPGDPRAPCRLGAPGGRTYAESLANELAGLRSILQGRAPLYGVTVGRDGGCFDLVQLRIDPRVPFGTEARLCFDPRTGAPANTRVRYAGGIVEVVAVTRIRGTVSASDLQP